VSGLLITSKDTEMITVIKKYGIPLLLAVVLTGGVYNYFTGRAEINKLTYQDGLYQQERIAQAQILNESEKRVKDLQDEIVALDDMNKALIDKVNEGSQAVVQVVATQTALADARKLLTDKDDIIHNQDLQIQEFYKERVVRVKRFNEVVQAFNIERAAKEAALKMAKEYYDLWQGEKNLHLLSQQAYAEYKSQQTNKKFKLTIKGIGENVLAAAAGYGLGRLTN